MTSKEALIFTFLYFRTAEDISSYCHEDADPVLLGGMIDQWQYLHPKPQCNHQSCVFSSSNFFPVRCFRGQYLGFISTHSISDRKKN